MWNLLSFSLNITNAKVLCCIMLLASCFTVSAQNETSNWYFGKRAGMNFSNNQATVVNDGMMTTLGSCSSISDKNGNLMLYTDGYSVWNREHEIMENGTDLYNSGIRSESVVIVPKPNDENVYYIFTTSQHSYSTTLGYQGISGLFYTEITFSTEYPLGKVTQKNIRLSELMASSVTAIHHAPTNTIRVISVGPETQEQGDPYQTFYIFTVTENGVQTSPVEKTVSENFGRSSFMKISPDGTKIIVTINHPGIAGCSLHIYNFNNHLLEIDLIETLDVGEVAIDGIEFSQDSKVLYFSNSFIDPTSESNQGQTSQVIQYNLDPEQGVPSQYLIATSSFVRYCSLQLASNGKIYIANHILSYYDMNQLSLPHISVIDKPEKLQEDCDFQHFDVELLPMASYSGLPKFVVSFLRNRIITENRCVTEAFDFDLDAYADITAVSWDFGDGTSSTAMAPTHQYSTSGEYLVKATITINNHQQPLYKEVTVYPFPTMDPNQTLRQCDIDNDGIANFNLHTVINKIEGVALQDYELSFYSSYNDAINDLEIIANPDYFQNSTNPQELFVRLSNGGQCEMISNFFIEAMHLPGADAIQMYTCENSDNVPNNGIGSFDLTIKEDEIRTQFNLPSTTIVNFYPSALEAEMQTNALPLELITSDTTIWVRIDTQELDCIGILNLQLIVAPSFNVDLEDQYFLCTTQPSVTIDGGPNNSQWEWEWKNDSDMIISTDYMINLFQEGNYSLTIHKNYNGIKCSATKEFTVTRMDLPIFKEVITENQKITIVINGIGNYEFSLDNVFFYGDGTSHTFNGLSGGIYTVYVRDKLKCTTIDLEVVLVNYSKFFTPNQDGFHDSWKIEGLSNRFYYKASIFIYNRYGKLLHFMDLDTNNQAGWNGIVNDEQLPATDYWFKADLTDKGGNSFTKNGHFSLIR